MRHERPATSTIDAAERQQTASKSVWIARRSATIGFGEQCPQLARDIDAALAAALRFRDPAAVTITPVAGGDGRTDGVILTIVFAA